MMCNQAVLANGFWNEFLLLCRSKFAVLAANGIRVSIFSNLIVRIKQQKHL
ncbi:hypothetical protein KDN24_24125 [Bacillus sp. Bva_UNVM-123]|uniref:RAxF-45 family protein n=1 Tax=Bacillus sp. Bva_UNVM-123 TaxID=2829798 RepID=UPI00391F4C03